MKSGSASFLVVLIAVSCFVLPQSASAREIDTTNSGKQSRRIKDLLGPYSLFRDIPYIGNPTSKSQRLDLYIPKKKKFRKKDGTPFMPLVIWIHGGGWRSGDKSRGPFRTLISKGFAVASINYRLSQEAKFPAQIHDCKNAVVYLKKHATQFGYDPSRVGVWGASAGGHLAALLGSTTGSATLDADKEIGKFNSDVQAVCDWFGPIDLLSLVHYDSQSEKYKVHPIVDQLLGVKGVRKVDAARQASPLTYVGKGMPPVLIVHGDRDKLVPLEQSKVFFKKLKEFGVNVTLNVVSGGHGFPGFGMATRGRTARFFERVLAGNN